MTTRPATINFALYPYATFVEEQVLRDCDGDPIDLTGYHARIHIRRERDDPSPLFDLSSDPDGGITLGGDKGTIRIRIPHTETAKIKLADPDGEMWVYDLLLTDTAHTPSVSRVFQGSITVYPAVTRVP